jgi:hypothetical protein
MALLKPLRIAWPGLALAVAQFPAGWAVFFAAHSARVIWIEESGDMELPLGTILAIRFGMFVPCAVLAACAVLLAISWRRRLALTGVVLGLAICEIVLLAYFAFGLLIPGMWILHRMGNGG